MIYFTASEPDGNANTHFLDRQTTDRLKEIGYVFNDPEHRIGDDYMAALAEHFKFDFKPQRFQIKPGDAIVFDAPNVLHRGAYPKMAPRYSMEVALIPSPVHWRSACQRTEFPKRSDLNHSYPPVDWSLA